MSRAATEVRFFVDDKTGSVKRRATVNTKLNGVSTQRKKESAQRVGSARRVVGKLVADQSDTWPLAG